MKTLINKDLTRQKFKAVLNLALGFFIIFCVQKFSEFIVWKFSINFPASLIGMLIFAILLYFKIIPIKWVKQACSLLLSNMVLFFVPIVVGITLYLDILAQNLLALCLVVMLSTMLTMVITGLVVDFFVNLKSEVKR